MSSTVFVEDGVRHQVRAVAVQIAGITRSHQRTRDKLRRAAARHEVGQDLVVAGLRAA